MTIEEMNRKKREFGYSYEIIALKSGLPIGTVQKVLGGITKHPRYATLQALEKAFTTYYFNVDEEGNAHMLGEGLEYDDDNGVLRDNPASYGRKKKDSQVDSPRKTGIEEGFLGKRQGEYTVEDYFRIPDGVRAELIDGVLYDMDSPTMYHQIIAGEIFAIIRNYIKDNKGTCIPFIAPAGVQLDMDDKTMVEPDVFVVCNRDMIRERNMVGAPDFIVEVLSPSTRSKDMKLKLSKYMNAGVREYWMVDPKKKKVIVHDFANEDTAIYSFEDRIPIAIYDGKCVVDFAEIKEAISFFEV